MKNLLFSIVFFLPYILFAAATDADTSRHSAIVEADGYVFLSDNKTIADLREEARAQAKREALEKGQTYIKSVSKVENYQLTYDLVESAVREAMQKAPTGPLLVRVWTNKPSYEQGQTIKIHLHGNKDFYARVLYIDARGNRVQLVPNQHRRDNFFKGGIDHTIPSDEDHFSLEVNPPFGRENIVVYASTAPLGDVDTQKMGDALYSVETDLNTVGVKTRGVKIVASEGGESGAAEFYESGCEVVTKE